MVRYAVFAVAGFAILFASVVWVWPSRLHVERSIRIGASPARAMENVLDSRRWSAWLPWSDVARVTVEKHESAERVLARLDFAGAWPETASILFTFAPAGGGTTVTWSMDVHSGFLGKAAYLFLDVGSRQTLSAEVDRGLVAMKVALER